MESRAVYIYGLWDPRDGRLRYIGKTIDPVRRLWRHQIDYDKGKVTHCSTWVKGLLNENLEPMIEILEECTENNWREAERDWIAKARNFGLDLTNMVDGGLGGTTRGQVRSEETRRKLSQSLKGRYGPMTGKKLSPERKAKLLEGRRGIKPRLGMKNSPEQNAKIGAANAKALKGRKVSEEFKEHLQQIAIERWKKEGERERHRERTNTRKRDSKGRLLPKEDKE